MDDATREADITMQIGRESVDQNLDHLTVQLASIDDSSHGDAPWHFVSSGFEATAYRKIDGKLIRHRIVLHGKRAVPQRITHLKQRLRLMSLTRCPWVASVQNVSLEEASPSFILTGIGITSLAEAMGELTPDERMFVVGQLLDLVQKTHHLGLMHGRLSAACIRLARNADTPQICVDYSGVEYEHDVASQRAEEFDAEDSDLAALKLLMRQLILPSNDSIDARTRAALRHLMLDDGASPSPQQWLALLQPFLPSGKPLLAAVDRDPASSSDLDDENDRTGVIQLQSALHRDDHPTPRQAECPTANTSTGGPPPTSQIRNLVGTTLGRYRIDSLIGQGGMGTVYRGVDLSDDRAVAIKVLRNDVGDIVQAIRRFRKEARMLADVQNDYVTKLHHVGIDSDFHYMVMEFVDGTDMKTWSVDRLPLSEPEALGLIADIARALVDAHENGVVHRDIKPENVLMGRRQNGDGETLADLHVKLTDFGIARHVQQSVSLEMTRAGSMLGTPRYMSPEQCRGSGEVGVEADIYALGVTLYELLTGHVPFQASDPMKLAAMHCFEPPPSIGRSGYSISDAADGIVNRMLAKDPKDRFANASQLLTEIERVLRGDPADFEAHPHMPTQTPSRVWQKSVEWELDSTPDQLWPFVSNTERLNRAIGLPPVHYETVHDQQLGLRKFGSFRMAGFAIRWEEHPFEWIEGQRMGILREFTSGPFRWFMSIVNLQPHGIGTRLRHEVRIEYRNVIGRMLTTVEADWKGFRHLDRVYQRMDAAIQGRLPIAEGSDAFERPPTLPGKIDRQIAQRVEDMIAADAEMDVAQKLGEYVRTACPQVLAQIRPRRLANDLQIPDDKMIDACLIGASQGLLSMRWEVLCPTCRVAAESTDTLFKIDAHTRCEACDVSFRSNLAESIELVFRPHADIRSVDDANYCIGGPEHSPHVVAQVRIEAGERIELPIRLGVGDYAVRSPHLPRSQSLRIRRGGAPSQCEIMLSRLGESTDVPTLRSGSPTLRLTNDFDRLHVVRIERMIPRDDCVTAAVASTLPRFRELFPEQTFDVNNPIRSEQVTLLASSIENIDALYDQLGESEAYQLVRDQQRCFNEIVVRQRGSVTKTIGESSLAVFDSCENAVSAAIEFNHLIKTEESLQSLSVGIGLHRGRTLVATENSRLDYVGASVRGVQSLPHIANGQIAMTETVFADPAVVARFGDQLARSPVEETYLPGIANCRVQRMDPTRGQQS